MSFKQDVKNITLMFFAVTLYTPKNAYIHTAIFPTQKTERTKGYMPQNRP